ncbi:MAG: methyl-accepting chemotaxis protein [Anaeromyxobacteraceae bacterium]
MKRMRYDLYGAGVGLLLPFVATLIVAAHRGVGLLEAQRADPLLWIMDTVPFVVGALGVILGRQQRALDAQARTIAAVGEERDRLHRTAHEVLDAAHLLLGNATAFNATTMQTAASVRESTAKMTQLSLFATTAAVHAETVIGLAHAAAPGPDRHRSERETIDALSRTLAEAVALARDIAQVAQRQAEGIDAVLLTMNEIYLATEETQVSTTAVAAKARSLTDLALALRGAVAPA